jgi:ribosomal protein L7Ae-like RNA K-turn-binding protein
MRKAGRLEIGETNTGSAVKAGKAKLLLVAADASDNAKKRAEGYLAGRRALLVPLPYTKDDLSELLGKGGCSMAAVTDIGLAEAFVAALAEADPTRYQETAIEIGRRKDRAVRRKAERPNSKPGRNQA